MATRTITVDFSVANTESIDAAIGGFTRKLDAAQQRATTRRRGTPENDEEASAKRLAALREREGVRLESKLALLREKAAQQQAAREERVSLSRLSKEERAKVASERKVAREIEREGKKAAREVEKERLAGERRVAREQKAAARELAREQKASERERVALSRRVTGVTKQGLNAPFGLAMGAGRMAAGVIAGGLALGGSAGIYASVRSSGEAQKRAIALVNSTDGKVTEGQLMSQSRLISEDTGIGRAEAIAGVAQFVSKTGDIETAMANWSLFGDIALATGSTIEDIAAAAADMSSKFDIKSVEDMRKAFAGLIQQGKDGSFELNNMAAEFPALGAVAKNFGLTGAGGLNQLGALAQIAKESTKSPEMATTAIESFFNQLQAKNSDLEKGSKFKIGKFSIFRKFGDQQSGTKDLDVLIPELIDATRGNTGKQLKILDKEGTKAIASLNAIYNQTVVSTGGTQIEKRAAATEAVRSEIVRRIETNSDPAKIGEMKTRAQEGSWNKIERIVEQLRNAFGDQLLPVLEKAIPKFQTLIPTVVDLTDKFVKAAPAIIDLMSKIGAVSLSFANWAANNPLEGALVLVSAGIIKAVAVNAIGLAVGKLIAGIGTAGVAAGGVASVLNPLTIALATLGIGLYAVHKAISGSKYDDRREGTVSDVYLGDYAKKFLDQNGDTPETQARIAKIKDEVQNSEPSAYSADTKKFVDAYVFQDPLRQLQQSAGMDPLDDLDREKIINGIDGAVQAKAAFQPKRPERQNLTEIEALSMGIDPATLGIESTIFAPEPDLSGVYRRGYANETSGLSLQDVVNDWRQPRSGSDNPFQEGEDGAFQTSAVTRQETSSLTEAIGAASKFADIAPILKEAAEAQRKSAEDLRSAARAARDGFQPNRTFQ